MRALLLFDNKYIGKVFNQYLIYHQNVLQI